MTARRIMFVISSLAAGGAERVASTMAAYWAKAGHTVSFVTWLSQETDYYLLPPEIRRFVCCDGSGPFVPWFSRRLRGMRLRSIIKSERPDVIISFIDRTNVIAVGASIGLKVPVVISERVDPELYSPGPLWRILRNAAYGLASRVVVQTEAVKKKVMAISPKTPEVCIIPNPVSAEFFAGSAEREKMILACGRLTAQKGFDVLIRAFAEICGEIRGYQLVIAGEGPEEKNLRALAGSLDCGSMVIFPGLLADIGSWYRRSSVFVLSSRYEGFPNVLLEAMASGCAVIATDCPSGPSEILTNEKDGLLIPPEDPLRLAGAIGRCIKDEAFRRALSLNASNSASRFSVQRIMTQWDSILDELAFHPKGSFT